MKKSYCILISLILSVFFTGCLYSDDVFILGTTVPEQTESVAAGGMNDNSIEEDEIPLPVYFPYEHIDMPLTSKVINIYNDFDSKEDTDWCLEVTLFRLLFSKSEAVEYFKEELLKNETISFTDSGDKSEFIPLDILAEFPDVVNYEELSAKYPYPESDVYVSSIKLDIYTADDNETIVIAKLEVTYTGKPVNGIVHPFNPEKEPEETPTVKTMYKTFMNQAREAGFMVFDYMSFGSSVKHPALGGFDVRRPEGERFTILEYESEEEAKAFIEEKMDASYAYITHDRFVAVYLTWYNSSKETALIEFIMNMFKDAAGN